MALGLINRLGLKRILRGGEVGRGVMAYKMAYLNSIFPMVIALFDPNHLPIDLCQDCRSTLLWTYNRVVVWSGRYKVTIIARPEFDPHATERHISISSHTHNERQKSVRLFCWLDPLDHPFLVIKQLFVFLWVE